MSSQSTTNETLDLPKIFETVAGTVDVELIEEVCKIVPNAGKRIRALLDSCGVRIKPQDDIYLVLSNKITSLEFRDRWYLALENGPPRFDSHYFLIGQYVQQRHKNIGFYSTALRSFFLNKVVKGKKLKFPILGKIDILVDELEKVTKISPKDAALGAWSLMEHCRCGSKTLPNEKSLRDFSRTLTASLQSRGMTDLLALLSPGSWEPQKSEEKENLACSDPKAQESVVVVIEKQKISETKLESNLIVSQKFESFAVQSLNQTKDAVRLKIIDYQQTVNLINAECNDLKSTLEPSAIIKSIENRGQHLVTISDAIRDLIDFGEKNLLLSIDKTAERFNLNISHETYILTSASDYDKWEQHYSSIANQCEPIFRLNIAFNEISLSAQREVEKNQLPAKVSYNEIAEFCKKKSEEISLIAMGSSIRDRLDAVIGINFRRLEWNPLESKDLRNEDWQNLALYLISRGLFGQQLGVILRVHFAPLSTVFSNLIEKTLSTKNGDVNGIFQTILHLTLGQIEHLATISQTRYQQRFLAAVQLHAYLCVVTSSKIKAFEYWSAFPLAEYTHKTSDDIYANFFNLIFEKSITEVDPPITLQVIRKLLGEVRSLPKDMADVSTNPLKEQIKNAVRYYKRGGNTYAELWYQAHSTIISPLQKLVDEENFSQLVEEIDDLTKNFEIENHIGLWKTFIPEHLRKRSEYDKHIRAQVKGKIDELGEWAESYRIRLANAPTRADSLKEIRTSIKLIAQQETSQPDAVAHWFAFLSNPQKKSFFSWSTSRTIQPASDEPVILLPQHTALYPRVRLGGVPIIHADILADQLIESMGFHSAENLAVTYASIGEYEKYFSLSTLVDEGFSPDLDRRVEEAVEELTITQKGRIDALDKRLVESAPEEGFNSYTQDLYRLLNEQMWNKLEIELVEVERLAKDLDSQRVLREAKAELQKKITRFGGPNMVTETLEALQSALDAILESLEPRKKHINALRVFCSFESAHLDIVEAAELAISELDELEALPSAEHSAYITYVLEQATVPVSEELHRHRTLIPAYVAKLRTLAMMLISSSGDRKFLQTNDSQFLRALEETAELWTGLARRGKEAAELIERRFSARGIVFNRLEIENVNYWLEPQTPVVSHESGKTDEPAVHEEILTRSEFKLREFTQGVLIEEKKSWTLSDLRGFTKNSDWKNLAWAALSLYDAQSDKQSSRAIDLRVTWMLSIYLLNNKVFAEEDYSIIFHSLNANSNLTAFQLINATKSFKGLAGELVNKFLFSIWLTSASADNNASDSDTYNNSDSDANRLTTHELLNILADRASSVSRIRSLVKFSFAVNNEHESPFLHNVWDFFSGDSKQAETRSSLMHLFWKCDATTALACCLTYISPSIGWRKAEALASAAGQARLTGRFELIESFFDLKKQMASKPFNIFLEMLRTGVPRQIEAAAAFSLIGRVEKTQSANVFQVLLNIDPRKSDCPDTLTLVLPRESPVRFQGDQLVIVLEGPFMVPASRPLIFELTNINATNFKLQLTCSALSITGSTSRFAVDLEIDLSSSDTFKPLSSDDIEDAFNNFPEYQMRGSDYVSRIEDEKKIERSLFASRTVRSLWIASPRRSGKTTMLYRILDAYSHKVGRDAIVVYLTMDRSFTESVEFNDWVWNRIRTIPANRELREMFGKFDDLGRDLPWTADAGTFLGELATRFMSHHPLSRVIFLLDEVDKFASMHFAGGKLQEAASAIMWQLRQLIGERRDIGIVFAGSSAARRLFVTNSDAPFFNSITLIELTPFSCRGSVEELASREIVEPRKVAARYILPKESLEHLIWVCAGIPYYMKLVAGATIGTVRQSHIMTSDINEGLRSLLKKASGVVALDEMSGDPGSDELRTMAIENGDDRLLTLAVLYTVAETYSALGGHDIYRQNLVSSTSPLVTKFGLKTKQIDRGLRLCVELGLLTTVSSKDLAIVFVIPILGESIRYASGRLWAHIDHELSALAESGAANVTF